MRTTARSTSIIAWRNCWETAGGVHQEPGIRSQDNALVEGKNGAVIRKLIGYGYIAGEHAEAIGKFYTAHFNPYLNFHRPGGFATVSLDERGKRRHRCKTEDYRTPLEKLKSMERAGQSLKPGVVWRRSNERPWR